MGYPNLGASYAESVFNKYGYTLSPAASAPLPPAVVPTPTPVVRVPLAPIPTPITVTPGVTVTDYAPPTAPPYTVPVSQPVPIVLPQTVTPPVEQTVTETPPPPTRIRLTPDMVTSPVPSATTPAPSSGGGGGGGGGGGSSPSGGAEIYSSDGSPISTAAIAVTPSTAQITAFFTSPLGLLLAAGSLFLLSRSRRT